MNKTDLMQGLLVIEPVVTMELGQDVIQHLQLLLGEHAVQQLPHEHDHDQLKSRH